MAITKEQKAALQAAGYTVKGNNVLNAKGASVGGYNENGNIWSGSSKVRDILKSKPAPQATSARQTPKPASKPRTAAKPVTKDAMKGYRAGEVTTSRITPRGGRGDGGAERVRRAADRALANAKPKSEKRVPGRALWRALTGGGNPKNYMDERKRK